MLTLNDGRSEFWQWDTGRKLKVDAECSQVHFSNKILGRSIDVDVVDGIANIPDILLQTDKELIAWAFVGTPENGYTKISRAFKVNRRNKPSDYVFTPPEQTSLEEIMERLDDLEAIQDPDAIKNAVDDYLSKNPVTIEETDPTVPNWAKEEEKPKYTADEVGAVDAKKLPEAINTALTQAKESGEFDGPVGPKGDKGDPGPKGDKGDPGTGGGIDVTGATVGQTVKIAAVDSNGMPTAWEPVDFPSGDDEELWEHILTYTEETGPDLYEHIFSQEPDGTAFNFKKLVVHVYSTAATANAYITFQANRKAANLGYVSGITTAGGVTSVLYLESLKVKWAGGSISRTLKSDLGVWTAKTANSNWTRRGGGVPMWEAVNNIYEINIGGSLPMGSTITIYGVRM